MIRLIVIAIISLSSFFLFHYVIYHFTENNDLAAWIALFLSFIGMPIILLQLWPGRNLSSKCPEGKGLYPECLFVVKIETSKIIIQRPDGKIETLAISDLQEVAIVTNDSGPMGTDLWWVLSGKSQELSCAFPGGATGEKEVLQFVQELSGFNNEQFIQSMGSTSNAKFICWSAST